MVIPQGPARIEGEASFTDRLVKAGRSKGWSVMHVPERWVAESTAAGFPDIMMIHYCGRVIVAELKTDRQRSQPRDEQRFWLSSLKKYIPETYLWRPKHWELIMKRLDCPCGRAQRPHIPLRVEDQEA